jgi:hypothetical protein
MVDLDAAFGEELLEVAVGQAHSAGTTGKRSR